MKRSGKEVLIATVGTAPQVVTLTLDALLERGFLIHHALVIHTNPSHHAIADALNRLREEEKFYQRGRPFFKFSFVPIRDGSCYPQDITNEREAKVLLRVLYKTVVKEKRKGNRVHLSIAGGRKVMAAYGMVVAHLLFEENDCVWHLLSEDPLLQSHAMHANLKAITLVPVPILQWSFLPSTLGELLIWDDPIRAMEKQKEIQRSHRLRHLKGFWDKLTPAEKDLIREFIKRGGTNKELACALHRTPKTIANQFQSIYEKYRDHFDLPPGTKVRSRLLTDLSPCLDLLDESP